MTVVWSVTIDAMIFSQCVGGGWASFNIELMSAIYDGSAGWSALNNTYQTVAAQTTNSTTCLYYNNDAFWSYHWVSQTFQWTLSGISLHNGDPMYPRTSIQLDTFLDAPCPSGCAGAVEDDLGNPSDYFTAQLDSMTVTQP